ncbi:hypothetical protein NPIL_325221 [Nephila pilipes]|uniref:Uncharacterized protein n=1 Tax=Nephila pilipes TaxID=299642 RepID=A0A8X6MUG5_NEPPI|nr:hypothetical protein NPIL_325221 [Nephila pilipes]
MRNIEFQEEKINAGENPITLDTESYKEALCQIEHGKRISRKGKDKKRKKKGWKRLVEFQNGSGTHLWTINQSHYGINAYERSVCEKSVLRHSRCWCKEGKDETENRKECVYPHSAMKRNDRLLLKPWGRQGNFLYNDLISEIDKRWTTNSEEENHICEGKTPGDR